MMVKRETKEEEMGCDRNVDHDSIVEKIVGERSWVIRRRYRVVYLFNRCGWSRRYRTSISSYFSILFIKLKILL